MFRIIYVPIESLEERYSKQWNRWFPKEFDNKGISYVTIDPPSLSDKINEGAFLDVCNTNYYKSLQMTEICRMIYNKDVTDEDVFLFADAWNPSLTNLSYIRNGLGLKFKIVGCLHAGSYDPYDFLAKKGMEYWAEDIENSWFKILDKIFVATNFHKRFVCSKRKIDPKKVIVTGFPIYDEQRHDLQYDSSRQCLYDNRDF